MSEFNQDLCNKKHEDIEKGMDDIKTFLMELKAGQNVIHNKLFVDNGTESIQSRINRMDNWIKGVCASVVLIAIPVLLLGIRALIEVLC